MSWDAEESAELNLPLCREILSESHAKLIDTLDSSITPILGREELVRGWTEGVADRWSMLRRYLEIYASSKNPAPARTVKDPSASTEVHEGLFRQAFIRRLQRQGSTYIVQTLRRGLAQKLMLDEGRVVSERRAAGNASSADGISNTTSENPDGFWTVRFEGCDPLFRDVIVTQALQQSWSSGEVSRYGISSSVKCIHVGVAEDDDGTLVVDVLLALPQYTLKAYQNTGTLNQYDVIYVWNVPKALAQDVLDAWKIAGTGRSATCSFNTDQRLVDIMLSKRASIGSQFPAMTLRQSCDTVATFYMAWGLSEDNAQAYWQAKGPAASSPGQSASGRISDKGDGTFDVYIVVLNVTFDESIHKLSVKMFEGGLYERESVYLYNVPKVDLEGDKSDPDEDDVDEGYLDLLCKRMYPDSFKFKITGIPRITRSDNCTFDCQFDIVTLTPGNTEWIPVYNDGIIARHVKRFWNQDGTPSDSYVSATDSLSPYNPEPGYGIKVKISIQNHSVVNGGLHSYDRIRTARLKQTHIILKTAEWEVDDQVIRSWVIGGAENPKVVAWVMRRTRPVVTQQSRIYSFSPVDVSTSDPPVVATIGDAGTDGVAQVSIASKGAGYDAERLLHFHDYTISRTTTWGAPQIFKIGEGGEEVAEIPSTPAWNSGSGGWSLEFP